jgi:hypothetical protein
MVKVFDRLYRRISSRLLHPKGWCVMLYYALTHNEIFDLGNQLSPANADHVAVDQFNIHQSPSGYIIVNHRELEAIKNILDRRGVGVY